MKSFHDIKIQFKRADHDNRGGIGLDACLSENLKFDRTHGLTIPDRCLYTPLLSSSNTTTTINSSAEVENSGLTNPLPKNGTSLLDTTKSSTTHKPYWIIIPIGISLIFLTIYVTATCILRAKSREQLKRVSDNKSNHTDKGDCDWRSSAPRKLEKRGRISKFLGRKSNVLNDHDIELASIDTMIREAASFGTDTPGTRTPSLHTLDEVHAPPPAVLAAESSPTFSNQQQQHRHLETEGNHNADVSEVMFHHEHFIIGDDDVDNDSARVTTPDSIHERLTSVVVMQKHTPRRLESIAESSESASGSSENSD